MFIDLQLNAITAPEEPNVAAFTITYGAPLERESS